MEHIWRPCTWEHACQREMHCKPVNAIEIHSTVATTSAEQKRTLPPPAFVLIRRFICCAVNKAADLFVTQVVFFFSSAKPQKPPSSSRRRWRPPEPTPSSWWRPASTRGRWTAALWSSTSRRSADPDGHDAIPHPYMRPWTMNQEKKIQDPSQKLLTSVLRSSSIQDSWKSIQ